jgi:hypothetical protein
MRETTCSFFCLSLSSSSIFISQILSSNRILGAPVVDGSHPEEQQHEVLGMVDVLDIATFLASQLASVNYNQYMDDIPSDLLSKKVAHALSKSRRKSSAFLFSFFSYFLSFPSQTFPRPMFFDRFLPWPQLKNSLRHW